MPRRSTLLAAFLALAAPALAHAADLAIEIEGIRVQTGTVKLQVMGSDAAWQGKGKAAGRVEVRPDGDRTLSLKVAGLAPGRYAVRVMHDENDNGTLDTAVFGIPTEGYGYSNNPRLMRAAKFEEAAFDVGKAGARVRIVMR